MGELLPLSLNMMKRKWRCIIIYEYVCKLNIRAVSCVHTCYHTIPKLNMVVEYEQCENGAIGGKEWIGKSYLSETSGEKGNSEKEKSAFHMT